MRTIFSKVLSCFLVGGLAFILFTDKSFSAPQGDAFGVYDTATGKWYVKTLFGKTIVDGVQWGDSTMAPVIGEYNGDGKTDLGVYGTNTGEWKIRTVDGQVLLNGNPFPASIGGPGFTPISKVYAPEYLADAGWPSQHRWKGDKKADPCLFQSINGQSIFHVMRSYDGTYTNIVFETQTNSDGFSGDYDGDGISDLTVYEKMFGNWTIFASFPFLGEPGYISYSGLGGLGYSAYATDFDGDHKSDLLVVSTNGQWEFLLVGDNTSLIFNFGGPGTPVPGDYDGDGRADIVCYEEATGQWTILFASLDASTTFQLGGPGQIPFAFPYDVFAVPTNFTASMGTFLDKVHLQWDTIAEATGYKVYRNSSNDTSTATNLVETTSASYDDTTAEPNTAYYYWVKAKYAQGVSGFSDFAIGSRTPFINPDVKVNSANGPLTVSVGTPITVTVEILPAAYLGIEADWWIMAQGFGSWYYLVSDGFSLHWVAAADYTAMHPIYQGPLFDLAPFSVLESYSWLPPGEYAFYFAIDTLMDGLLTLDALHYDSVPLTIQ